MVVGFGAGQRGDRECDRLVRDAVALVAPGCPGLFAILDGLGLQVAAVTADEAGIVPEALERVLAERAVTVVCVQAGPQNPTGVVTPPARLKAIAAVLDRHDVTVIEDLTLSELVFAGRPQLELAHLCRRATVVSTGSFSKVMWGGLRVGWLRGPTPLIERPLHHHLAIDLGPATPSQLFCLALLPHLPDIADRRRRSWRSTPSEARRCCASRCRSGTSSIPRVVPRCGSARRSTTR